MDTTGRSHRQAHRLIQSGLLLFLFALLVGVAVPRFVVPRLALSTHLLGIMQGLFLMTVGLLWPRLRLTSVVSRIGFVLAVYGCFAAWTANLLAATWGAGSSIVPIAAGNAHGSALQEGLITILLRSAGVSLIAVTVLLLWGLRSRADQAAVVVEPA